jgi:hypothetical protein
LRSRQGQQRVGCLVCVVHIFLFLKNCRLKCRLLTLLQSNLGLRHRHANGLTTNFPVLNLPMTRNLCLLRPYCHIICNLALQRTRILALSLDTKEMCKCANDFIQVRYCGCRRASSYCESRRASSYCESRRASSYCESRVKYEKNSIGI